MLGIYNELSVLQGRKHYVVKLVLLHVRYFGVVPIIQCHSIG